MEVVELILRSTDLFTMLSMHSDAEDDKVAKSYRKLLLQVHPDKNDSPKAHVATQKINEEYAQYKNSPYTYKQKVKGKDNRVVYTPQQATTPAEPKKAPNMYKDDNFTSNNSSKPPTATGKKFGSKNDEDPLPTFSGKRRFASKN